MKIDDHLRNLKESMEEIEASIVKGLTERQRTIGFHTSAAAVDMLEILLHKNSLIDPGFLIKHEWFNSKKKIAEKFPFSFPAKEELFEIIIRIEEKRNILCYGKPQKIEVITDVVDNFNKLKTKFKEVGLDGI